MQSYIDKPTENRRKATENSASTLQQRSAPTFQFSDNRASTVAQRKIADAINSSPRQNAERKRQQTLFDNAMQLQAEPAGAQPRSKYIASPVQQAAKPNKTGLPDQLKAGIESLSGMDMSNVRVHYNSSKPAQLNALAYAQGNDIHLGSGQEQHLPHEAWHTVQQRQGRVKPTIQAKGERINNEKALGNTADMMGDRVLQRKIGAEIETPGVFLGYPADTPVSQGEVVGAIVPGIVTEIHLEGPEKTYATFEFATGLHGQYPPENPLSLTYQVGYLATWMKIAKMKGASLLKNMPLMALPSKWSGLNTGSGPTVNAADAATGTFQVNVSPTKATVSTFLDVFDNVSSYELDNDALTPKHAHLDQCLQNAKTFGLELYGKIITEMSLALKSSPPPILKAALKALTSVPRVSYFKYLRTNFYSGYGSLTLQIIDKNILDLLPRANLKELWTAAKADSQVSGLATAASVSLDEIIPLVLANALSKTTFPQLSQIDMLNPELTGELADDTRELLVEQESIKRMSMTELTQNEDRIRKVMSQLEMFRGANAIIQVDSPIDTEALRKTAHADMMAILAGHKILVKARNTKSEQPPPILQNTDSSLLPISKEQGEAGVYEIRNPFTSPIPIDKWETAIAEYEKMLREKGVNY